MQPFISNNYLGSTIERKTQELANAREMKLRELNGLPTVAPQIEQVNPFLQDYNQSNPVANLEQSNGIDNTFSGFQSQQADGVQQLSPQQILEKHALEKGQSAPGTGTYLDSIGRAPSAFLAGSGAQAVDTVDTIGEVGSLAYKQFDPSAKGIDIGTEDEKRAMVNDFVNYDDSQSKQVMQAVSNKVDKAFETVDFSNPASYKRLFEGENLDLLLDATGEAFGTSAETAAYSLGYIATAFVGGTAKKAAQATEATIKAITKDATKTASEKATAIAAVESKANSLTTKVMNQVADTKTLGVAAANITNNQLDDYVANGGEVTPTAVLRMFAINYGFMNLDKLGMDYAMKAVNVPSLLKGMSTGNIASLMAAVTASSAKLVSSFGAEFVQETLQSAGEEFNKRYDTELTKELSALDVATSEEVIKKGLVGGIVGGPAGTAMSAMSQSVQLPGKAVKGVADVVGQIGESGKKALTAIEMRALTPENRAKLSAKYDAESLVVDDFVSSMQDIKTEASTAKSIEDLQVLGNQDSEIQKIIEPYLSKEDVNLAEVVKEISKSADDRSSIASETLRMNRTKDATYAVLQNLKEESKKAASAISKGTQSLGDAIAAKINNVVIPDFRTAMYVSQSVAEFSSDEVSSASKVVLDTATEAIKGKFVPSEVANMYEAMTKKDKKAFEAIAANNPKAVKMLENINKLKDRAKAKSEQAAKTFKITRDKVLNSLPENSAILEVSKALDNGAKLGEAITRKNGGTLIAELTNLLTDNTVKNPKIKEKINEAINELKESKYYKEGAENRGVKRALSTIEELYEQATGEAVRAYEEVKATVTGIKNINDLTSQEEIDSLSTSEKKRLLKRHITKPEDKELNVFAQQLIANEKELLAEINKELVEEVKAKGKAETKERRVNRLKEDKTQKEVTEEETKVETTEEVTDEDSDLGVLEKELYTPTKSVYRVEDVASLYGSIKEFIKSSEEGVKYKIDLWTEQYSAEDKKLFWTNLKEFSSYSKMLEKKSAGMKDKLTKMMDTVVGKMVEEEAAMSNDKDTIMEDVIDTNQDISDKELEVLAEELGVKICK